MNIKTLNSLEKVAKRNYEDLSLSVSKYEVLNILVQYHFLYDKYDTVEEEMFKLIDFRCLTSDMMDIDGYLKDEYVILMYYQGKFGGVITETGDSTDVHYIDEFMATLFLGYTAILYTDRLGQYIDKSTFTAINSVLKGD